MFVINSMDIDDFLPEWKGLVLQMIINVSSGNTADDIVVENWRELFDKLNTDFDKEVFCYLGGATLIILSVSNANQMFSAVMSISLLCSSELALVYCCSYGIIPMIIKLLTLNIDQISVLIASTLTSIACIERFVPELVKNKLIEISLNLLTVSENNSLFTSLIMLVWDLCEHFEEHKRIVTENDGIEILVEKLNVDSEEVKCFAIAALWILASYSIFMY